MFTLQKILCIVIRNVTDINLIFRSLGIQGKMFHSIVQVDNSLYGVGLNIQQSIFQGLIAIFLPSIGRILYCVPFLQFLSSGSHANLSLNAIHIPYNPFSSLIKRTTNCHTTLFSFTYAYVITKKEKSILPQVRSSMTLKLRMHILSTEKHHKSSDAKICKMAGCEI